MKRIVIVIVILISFAFGQVVEEGIAFTTNQSYDEYLEELDAEYDRLHPRERVITFGDILNYIEKCYNDSTEVDKHIGSPFNCMFISYSYGSSECLVESHYNIEVWTHTTPTFEGFSEWIDRGK